MSDPESESLVELGRPRTLLHHPGNYRLSVVQAGCGDPMPRNQRQFAASALRSVGSQR